MQIKTVSKKMGIKEGMRSIFIDAPAEVMEMIEIAISEKYYTLQNTCNWC